MFNRGITSPRRRKIPSRIGLSRDNAPAIIGVVVGRVVVDVGIERASIRSGVVIVATNVRHITGVRIDIKVIKTSPQFTLQPNAYSL